MSSSIPAPTSLAPPVLRQALPIELMSTIWADRHGIHDSLATEEGAAAWLAALEDRFPMPTAVTGKTRRRVQELRDAARRVAAHVTGDPRARAASPTSDLRDALEVINGAAARAPRIPALVITDDGVLRAVTQGVADGDSVLSLLATSTIEFFGSAEAERLSACLAPVCVLYFVKDHPRRQWCSPACGNRARAARHYARRSRQS